jgi:hypothetical protein
VILWEFDFTWYHLARLREENLRISIGDVLDIVGVGCIANMRVCFVF